MSDYLDDLDGNAGLDEMERVRKLETEVKELREREQELLDDNAACEGERSRLRRERKELREALKRLGSNESFTTALDLRHSSRESIVAELKARMEFAQQEAGRECQHEWGEWSHTTSQAGSRACRKCGKIQRG